MTAATAARRPRLDRARVVEAARDLLDDEGFEAFSMNRLGERLGVTAMALYRHVSDRRELEYEVVALVIGDLSVDAQVDDWAAAVASWMHRVRDHWLDHPWLGRLLGNRTEITPPWLAALDHLAVVLERAGLPPELVAKELVRISRATSGHVGQESNAPLPQPGLAAMLASLPPDGRRRWRALVRHLDRYDGTDLFADLVAETITRLAVAVSRSAG